mmetsp:Transcript_16314/g.47009  ORF Transcript_16314/g.47009 Transcript_16314/m.47009 type:complete len:442 (+) Transcript_16314:527-1852(+)
MYRGRRAVCVRSSTRPGPAAAARAGRSHEHFAQRAVRGRRGRQAVHGAGEPRPGVRGARVRAELLPRRRRARGGRGRGDGLGEGLARGHRGRRRLPPLHPAAGERVSDLLLRGRHGTGAVHAGVSQGAVGRKGARRLPTQDHALRGAVHLLCLVPAGHTLRLAARKGLPRGRRGALPLAGRRAGHEHGPAGRCQLGLEARRGGQRGGERGEAAADVRGGAEAGRAVGPQHDRQDLRGHHDGVLAGAGRRAQLAHQDRAVARARGGAAAGLYPRQGVWHLHYLPRQRHLPQFRRGAAGRLPRRRRSTAGLAAPERGKRGGGAAVQAHRRPLDQADADRRRRRREGDGEGGRCRGGLRGALRRPRRQGPPCAGQGGGRGRLPRRRLAGGGRVASGGDRRFPRRRAQAQGGRPRHSGGPARHLPCRCASRPRRRGHREVHEGAG